MKLARHFPRMATAGALLEGYRHEKVSKSVLFWESADDRVLEAANRLAQTGVIQPVLLGTSKRPGGGVQYLSLHDIWLAVRSKEPGLIDELDDASACAIAVRLGLVDSAVGGIQWKSSDVLRAGIRQLGMHRDSATVSIGGLVEHSSQGPGKVMMMTDTGAVPVPSPAQLADIALNGARAMSRLTAEEPRVAFLASSTHGSGPSPKRAAIHEAIAIVRGRAPSIKVDGELQFDAAISCRVAQEKGVIGPVGGRANVLVFPDLESANIGYKVAEHLGAAMVAPVTMGLAGSFHDLSRGSTAEEIFDASIFACALASTCGKSDATPEISLNHRGGTQRA